MTFEASDRAQVSRNAYSLYFHSSDRVVLEELVDISNAQPVDKGVLRINITERQLRKVKESGKVVSGKTRSFKLKKANYVGIHVEVNLKPYVGQRLIITNVPEDLVRQSGTKTVAELRPVDRAEVDPDYFTVSGIFDAFGTALDKYRELERLKPNVVVPPFVFYESPTQRKKHLKLTSRRGVYT